MFVDPQAPLTIPDALAGAASSFGSRPAYVEGSRKSGRTLTWAQLLGRAEDVAAGLIALGLNTGDRVAICAENSIDWITAFYASVTAGAGAALVYFDLMPEEIAEQVTRPDCRFLFASVGVLRRLGDSLPAVDHVVLLGPNSNPGIDAPSLDDVAEAATEASRERLASCPPVPENLAAIVYTSGTTAGPKGVMLSHRNLIASAQAAVRALALRRDDSAVLVLPLHHSLAFTLAGVLPPLIGARIIIESDLRRIRERLQEYQPTIFFGVPALYELMYRNIRTLAESEGRSKQMQAWQDRQQLVKRLTGINVGPLVFRSVHKALGGRIHFLVSGAAPLKPQTVLDFCSLGLPLLQGCGLTETANGFAVQRYSRWRFLLTRYYENHVGSVGQVLPGLEVRLIDVPEKGICVAESGEGELTVRGDSVFLGYWQAPELTEEAMVDGWVRTGDLARLDKDGNIYLTGRAKYIIVLDSGEKVHPDEVEGRLQDSELIEDVCVTGRREREKTVVTAVIYPNVETVLAWARADEMNAGATMIEELVKREVDRLCKALAAYKRVSRIELTDRPLPKTAVRKVARGQIAESFSFDLETWLSSAPHTSPSNKGR